MTSCEISSFDYLDLCRLCLNKDHASVPIFDNEQRILQKITTCRLPIKVSKEDRLPTNICEECVKKIEMFYQFWNTTLNSEKHLLQLIDEISLEDKLLHELEVFNLNEVDQDGSINRINNTLLQISEHQNNINMDIFNDMSIITMSAVSDQQFTSVTLDSDSTFSALIQEAEENQDNESVTTELQQQKISEVSEISMNQTNYSGAKNRILESAVLQSMPLLEFSSYSESMHSPSSYFRVPSPSLFLEHLSDSSSMLKSGFEKFPDPEFIAGTELFPSSITEAEFMPLSIPEPEPIVHTITGSVSKISSLSNEESIAELLPSSSVTEIIPLSIPQTEIITDTIIDPISKLSLSAKKEIPNKKLVVKKKWTIPNEDRPRRHRDVHYCPHCMIGLTDLKRLGEHMRKEHQIERPFECEVCGMNFRSAMSINRHMRKHDKAMAKQFSCDQCDYATDQKSNLWMHIQRRHEKNYKITCELCGAGFMQRGKYEEHLERQHQDGTKPACNYCDRIFSYERNLRQHIVEHHPEKVYWPIEPKCRIPCPHCTRSFAKERSLLRHVKAQHSEPQKKLTCEQCGAQLSCKSTLAQHMRSHRGEKVAECNICGKRFAKVQNLRVHLRVHTGERPYKCTHCNKAFAQKTTLVHHTRIHTGERPYKCEQCEKGFVSGSLLRKHAANGKCQSTPKAAALDTANGEGSNAPTGGSKNES